jgi:hypothetical protein
MLTDPFFFFISIVIELYKNNISSESEMDLLNFIKSPKKYSNDDNVFFYDNLYGSFYQTTGNLGAFFHSCMYPNPINGNVVGIFFPFVSYHCLSPISLEHGKLEMNQLFIQYLGSVCTV